MSAQIVVRRRAVKLLNNRLDKCLKRIVGMSAIPTSDKPHEPLDGLYRYIFGSVPKIDQTSIHDIFHFLVLPSIWDGVISLTVIEQQKLCSPASFGDGRGNKNLVKGDLL